MYKLLVASSLLVCACSGSRKNGTGHGIEVSEVERIEKTLSADEMEGRKVFTPGIDKAAAFIAAEMQKTGLQFLAGSNSYMQPFDMQESSITSAKATVGGQLTEPENVMAISTTPEIHVTPGSGYKIERVKAGANFVQTIRPLLNSKENVLVLADNSFVPALKQLRRFMGPRFSMPNNIVVVLTANPEATDYDIHIQQQIKAQKLANVVGILPGKSKANEYVVFSGHYDHLGFGKANAAGDSLFNGANDDASGTTAVLMLAKYYKALNNNERTLIFVAFTAEESGGFGSRYFSQQLDPASVTAMFNIEMIGTESKWGTNSAYITGYEKTDMGKILEKNLEGSAFKFYPDPYPQQQLFYRSDNATLARQGVPAHTISTSKMDSEKYYHTQDDEFATLDMSNMAAIIKAIAVSATSIVAGKDAPARVNTADLK